MIRNITGEIVHQQSIPANTLNNKISLNKRFARGTYILELHSPYGTANKKLVVQ